MDNEMNDSSLERPGILKDVKIVLVGPAKCGKTALVQRFVNDTFSDVSFVYIIKIMYNINNVNKTRDKKKSVFPVV